MKKRIPKKMLSLLLAVLLLLPCFSCLAPLRAAALRAEAVKDRPHRVQQKAVMRQQMAFDRGQLLAVQVNQLPAFLAFAVEAYVLMTVLPSPHVLEARR